MRSVWDEVTLAHRMACMITYAGVFNDVIGLPELYIKSGATDKNEFDHTLHELAARRSIVIQQEYACLPALLDKVPFKKHREQKCNDILRSKLPLLKFLSGLPGIKFVGISGSIAAKNPVENDDNPLDVDLFVITRHHFLWLFLLAEAVFRNLRPSSWPLRLCISYVFDEQDLTIYNRNFYTANEIRNLLPVTHNNTYRQFIAMNQWVNQYFPGLVEPAESGGPVREAGLLNKFFFLLFHFFRCVKHFSLSPLKEISFKFDPHHHLNVTRKSAYYGGYQAMVQKKFARLFRENFHYLHDENLLYALFPDALSDLLRQTAFENPKPIVMKGVVQPLSSTKYGV
jgi:hypothetical protein